MFTKKILGGLFGIGLVFAPMFVVSIAHAATTTATSTSTLATSTLATTTPVVSTSTPRLDAVAVEKRVREYFADVPVMIEIARCESKFRQFTDTGAVLRGGMSGGMIGIFQFYEQIHAKAALGLGLDLATVEGNIGYARHLYEQSGTTPWRSCVPMTMASRTTNTELRMELMTKLIVLLQELLKLKLAGK